MTDEQNERAMKVWREAYRAGEDAYVEAVETGTTAVEAHEAGNQAAAAVIAADRAGLVARIAELEGALADMLHAVCHETGFVAAVRADSGLAYPWEPLDMAEAKARAALKDTRNEHG